MALAPLTQHRAASDMKEAHPMTLTLELRPEKSTALPSRRQSLAGGLAALADRGVGDAGILG